MIINFEKGVNSILKLDMSNAIKFYLEKLNISKEIPLTINIILSNLEECQGMIEVDDNENYIPEEFSITLNTTNPRDPLLQTLAHEIVHLKQYVTGELEMNNNKYVWKGKLWKEPSDADDAYFDSPWEIDAYGREGGLTYRYMKSTGR